ncbi:HET-domain-containing protein [Xylaria arbuscula]|nr:HET-domain-containing protein [Xylaria arbuscula]
MVNTSATDYLVWTTSPDGIRVPQLQPIPSNINKPGDALCQICQSVGFEPSKFFIGEKTRGFRSSPSDGHSSEEDGDDDDADNSINLGNIADVRSRTHCPFCRLALVAIGGPRVPNEKNGEPVKLEIDVMTNGFGDSGRARPTRVLMPSASAGDAGWVEEAAVFPEIVLMANDLPEATTNLVRPIYREKIDFSMVSNWLAICEAVHGDECRKRPGMDDLPVHPATILNEFRLIDVEQRCIVAGTSDCRYTALSYVWGQANVLRAGTNNIERLEKPGAFNASEFESQLPQTVKDAIKATRDIGIRYLWVDALCIIQDENYKEKLPHIKQMNRIYETAELVIVAMSSRDASSGLPGVRPWTRRTEQQIEQITPQLRLGVRTIYGNEAVGCVYETRGWTYQETCFARRQLIFTGGQVAFTCKYAGNWSEDRVVEDRAFVLNEFNEGGSTTWDEDDDIRSYEGPVQNYSDRTLSFPSDVYNAFAGVAQRIRDLLGVDLCHGIPPSYFDWCLLWDPMKELTRRQGTPSWSWSGWEGGAFPHIWDWYSPKTRRIQKALKVRTWIIWYQRVAHDSTECRLVWDARLENENARGSRNFYGGKVQSRFPMNCSQTQPTKRKLAGAPIYYPDILSDAPGSGFLQFWTVSVQFRLDHPVSEADSRRNRGDTLLGIFGASGRELGTIQVASSWLRQSGSLPLTGEFILLCEARDERADGGKYDEEPGWKYKIMLLEWHDDYAERVALGSINKGDELEGSPTWKEIILG